jgi:hypothetical protein
VSVLLLMLARGAHCVLAAAVLQECLTLQDMQEGYCQWAPAQSVSTRVLQDKGMGVLGSCRDIRQGADGVCMHACMLRCLLPSICVILP